MSTTLTTTDAKYRDLLAVALPKVIHTEDQNERYIAALEALHDQENVTVEEEQLAELLTLLVEDFENKHYQLKPASPADILRELMAANSLKQSGLLDVFGTRSVVSEVLSGKRDLSKLHIQKLSRRFHVSPRTFFPALMPYSAAITSRYKYFAPSTPSHGPSSYSSAKIPS
jgi:HTH-type transcriptional regulator/antitoxin HigA